MEPVCRIVTLSSIFGLMVEVISVFYKWVQMVNIGRIGHGWCWKSALKVIINMLLFYFFVHDCLFSMLELY